MIWRTPLNAGMRLPIALRFSDDVSNVIEPAVRELPDSLVERRIIKVTDSLAGKRIDFVGLQATITDVLVGTADRWKRIDYGRAAVESMGRNNRLARSPRHIQQLRIAWD